MRALFDAALFTVGNYWASGLGMVANLLTRLWIAPVVFGALSLVEGVYSYVGIYNGLYRSAIARELPQHRARGEHGEVVSVLGISYTFLSLSLIVESVALAGVGFLVREPHLRLAFWTFAVVNLFDGLAAAHRVTLMSTLRFRALGFRDVIAGTLQAALMVGLSWLWGFHGLFLAFALISVVRFILFSQALGSGWRPFLTKTFRRETVRRVLGVGTAIVLYGALVRLMLSVDRFFVAGFLSLTDLGYYSLGVAALGTIYLLPHSIAEALLPRLIGFLAKGQTESAVAAAQKVHITVVLLTAMTVVGAVLVVGPLVSRILPNYRGAVPAMEVMLLGGYLYGASAVSARIHYGTLRLVGAFLSALLGVGLVILLAFLLMRFGLVGVASATTAALGVYALLLNWSAQRILPGTVLVRWMLAGLVILGPVYGLLHWVGPVAGGVGLLGITAGSTWYLARLYRIRWRGLPSALQSWLAGQGSIAML